MNSFHDIGGKNNLKVLGNEMQPYIWKILNHDKQGVYLRLQLTS